MNVGEDCRRDFSVYGFSSGLTGCVATLFEFHRFALLGLSVPELEVLTAALLVE